MQGGEWVGVGEGVSQLCPNDTTTLEERGGGGEGCDLNMLRTGWREGRVGR